MISTDALPANRGFMAGCPTRFGQRAASKIYGLVYPRFVFIGGFRLLQVAA